MESEIEKEFKNCDNSNAWGPVYLGIKNEAAMQAIEREFSTAVARNPGNRNKNRYRDVSPYDHSRIKLSNDVYINASLVEVEEADRRYILTQGPLEVTVGHFWQMVWEQESKAVIMLNKLIENGVKKCYKYYPSEGEEEEMVFEDVSLRVSLVKDRKLDYYIERTLEIENTGVGDLLCTVPHNKVYIVGDKVLVVEWIQSGESREVIHYNYTTWPDFGVPQSPLAFLNFLMAVRQSGALDSNVGPSVVHCSAGIGRSGTFCLVDSSLVIIEKTKDMDSIDVQSLLLEMRTYRMGLIQTADQLRFSYLAIIDGGKRILSEEDSTLSVISDYIAQNNKKEDSPPPPPERTTSLPQDKPPPLPPRTPETSRKQSDLPPEEDYENQQKPSDEIDHVIQSKPKEDGTFQRKLQREERKRKTQEQINRMKEKQKDSELWKKRRSYIRPVAIGITLLIGGLLLYRYYLGR